MQRTCFLTIPRPGTPCVLIAGRERPVVAKSHLFSELNIGERYKHRHRLYATDGLEVHVKVENYSPPLHGLVRVDAPNARVEICIIEPVQLHQLAEQLSKRSACRSEVEILSVPWITK
jgi:hypothetical protein